MIQRGAPPRSQRNLAVQRGVHWGNECYERCQGNNACGKCAQQPERFS